MGRWRGADAISARAIQAIGPEGIGSALRSVCQPACRIYARVLAAAQRQGLVGMQGVPVVAIGIVVAVSRPVSAEAMQRVLVQSETTRANVAAAEASHVFAAKAATEMTSAAKASDVTSTAKTAAHMATATEAAASAVT